jgi:hypothetical protein
MRTVICSNCFHSFQTDSRARDHFCGIKCSIEYHTGMKYTPEETKWEKVTVAEATAQQEMKFE